MSSDAKKFDTGKAPLELLSNEGLVQIARVFEAGAKKYGRFNYKNGLAYSRVLGALLRHINAFNSGEDLDPETGLSHIAHAGAGIFMLLDYIAEKPDLDDRYKKEVK